MEKFEGWKVETKRQGDVITIDATNDEQHSWHTMFLDTKTGEMVSDSDIGMYSYYTSAEV